MSWSVGGEARDVGFAAEVKRVFGVGEGQVGGSPAALRALRAVQGFVEGAPLNIPAGCTVAFQTSGHMEQDGRGSVTVKVEIFDTPAEVAPAPEGPSA